MIYECSCCQTYTNLNHYKDIQLSEKLPERFHQKKEIQPSIFSKIKSCRMSKPLTWMKIRVSAILDAKKTLYDKQLWQYAAEGVDSFTTSTSPMDKTGDGRDFGCNDPIKGMLDPPPNRRDKPVGLLDIVIVVLCLYNKSLSPMNLVQVIISKHKLKPTW